MRLAGRCAHELARAVVEGIHVLQRERHAREFHQIALMEKFGQQRTMARERGVEGLEQIAQKFLRGSMGGGELESLLDVAADDVGYRYGELSRVLGLHQRP